MMVMVPLSTAYIGKMPRLAVNNRTYANRTHSHFLRALVIRFRQCGHKECFPFVTCLLYVKIVFFVQFLYNNNAFIHLYTPYTFL